MSAAPRPQTSGTSAASRGTSLIQDPASEPGAAGLLGPDAQNQLGSGLLVTTPAVTSTEYLNQAPDEPGLVDLPAFKAVRGATAAHSDNSTTQVSLSPQKLLEGAAQEARRHRGTARGSDDIISALDVSDVAGDLTFAPGAPQHYRPPQTYTTTSSSSSSSSPSSSRNGSSPSISEIEEGPVSDDVTVTPVTKGDNYVTSDATTQAFTSSSTGTSVTLMGDTGAASMMSPGAEGATLQQQVKQQQGHTKGRRRRQWTGSSTITSTGTGTSRSSTVQGDATSLLLQSLQAAVAAPLQLLSYTAGVTSRASKAALDLGQTSVNTAVNTTVNTAQAAASLPKAAAAAVAPIVRGASTTAATAMQGATAQTAAVVQTALQRAVLASRTGGHYAVTAGQTAGQRAGQTAAGLGHSAAAGVSGLRNAAGVAGTSAAAGGRRLAAVAAQGVNRVDHLAVNGVTGLTQAVAGLVTGLYHTWLQRVWLPYVQLLHLFNNALWSSAAAAGQLYLQGLTMTVQLLGQAAAAYYSLLTSATAWVRQAAGSTAVNLTQYGWQAAGWVYTGAWSAGQTYYNMLTATAGLLLRSAATAGGLSIEAARAAERGATPLVNASVNTLLSTLPVVNAAAAQAVNTAVNATSAAAAQAVSAASDVAVSAVAKQQQVLGGPRSDLMQAALTAGGQQASWSTSVLGQLLQDATEKGLTSRSAWLQPAAEGVVRTAVSSGDSNGTSPASRGEGYQVEPAAEAAAAAFQAVHSSKGNMPTANSLTVEHPATRGPNTSSSSSSSNSMSSSTPGASPATPGAADSGGAKQPGAAADGESTLSVSHQAGADQLAEAARQETAGGVHSVAVSLGVEAPGDTKGAGAAPASVQVAEGGASSSSATTPTATTAVDGEGRKLPSPYKLGFGKSFQLGHITPDITPDHSSSSSNRTSTASNLSEEDAALMDKEVAASQVDQSKAPLPGFDQPQAPRQGLGFDQPPTSSSSSSSLAAGGVKDESAQPVGKAPGSSGGKAAAAVNTKGVDSKAAAGAPTTATFPSLSSSSSGGQGGGSSRGSSKQQQQLPQEVPGLLDGSALPHMGSDLMEDQITLQPQGLLLAATGAGTTPKGGVTSGVTRVTPSGTDGTTGGFPGFDSTASGTPSLGAELSALGDVHTGLHRVPMPTLQEVVAGYSSAAGDMFDAADPLQQREQLRGAGKEVEPQKVGQEGRTVGSSVGLTARQAAAAVAPAATATDIPVAQTASSIESLNGSPLIDMMSNALALGLTSEEDLSSEQPGKVSRAVHKHYSSGKSSVTAESAAAAAIADVDSPAAAYGANIDLVSAASAPSSLPPPSAARSTPTTGSNTVKAAAAGRLPVLHETASSPAVLQDITSSKGRPEVTPHGRSHAAAAPLTPTPAPAATKTPHDTRSAGAVSVPARTKGTSESAASRADSAGLQSGTFFRAESGAVGSWPSGPVVEEELSQLDQLLSGSALLPSSSWRNE